MAKESYFLQHPKEQTFYRYFAMMLTLLGIGDQRWWGYDEPRWGLPLLVYYAVLTSRAFVIYIPYVPFLSQVLQLYLIHDQISASAMGSSLTIIQISFVVFIAVASSQRDAYVNLMKQFIEKIHLYNFRNDDEYIGKLLVKAETKIRYTFYLIIAVTQFISINWIITPMLFNNTNIESIRNGTSEFQSVIYFYMPFDYLHNFRNWSILHVINAFVTFLANTMMDFFKMLIYMFIFHWVGHINVLKYKVSKFRLSQDSAELIDIVKYHIFIRRIFSEIEESFGIIVTVTYLHNLIGDSLLLYNVMFGEKENLLVFALMVVFYMGDLVTLSFVLEEVRRQTVDLSDLVYKMPWQKMSIRDQKTYLIFLGRVQEPFEFVSFCGLRTGVRPMISIIKSTFSYYVMLKTSIRRD